VVLNSADVAPAGTVIDDGAVKAVLSIESDTATPPDGAAWSKSTEQLPLAPLNNLESAQDTFVS
jgi:hypothetical protein